VVVALEIILVIIMVPVVPLITILASEVTLVLPVYQVHSSKAELAYHQPEISLKAVT
jgi:hypothetical protein